MTYPLLPIGLIAAFLAYVGYVLLFKRDKKFMKQLWLPGVFFIVVWAVVYYLLLK